MKNQLGLHGDESSLIFDFDLHCSALCHGEQKTKKQKKPNLNSTLSTNSRVEQLFTAPSLPIVVVT